MFASVQNSTWDYLGSVQNNPVFKVAGSACSGVLSAHSFMHIYEAEQAVRAGGNQDLAYGSRAILVFKSSYLKKEKAFFKKSLVSKKRI